VVSHFFRWLVGDDHFGLRGSLLSIVAGRANLEGNLQMGTSILWLLTVPSLYLLLQLGLLIKAIRAKQNPSVGRNIDFPRIEAKDYGQKEDPVNPSDSPVLLGTDGPFRVEIFPNTWQSKLASQRKNTSEEIRV